MSYFRELPNLEYPSFLSDKNSSLDYIEVKNIFRRIKLRDDLQNTFTLFDKYEIPMGWSPDMVADEVYGSSELDWVVLITAGIINVRNEWPLSDSDIYDFALEKYGDDINSTRFYESKEIKDSDDKIIFPKGKVVDADFVFNYYDNGLKSVSGTNVRTGISNYEYEVRINDDKRNIHLLKLGHLQDFVNDMRDIMVYEKSPQYINETTARTENSNIVTS
tara:strand:+ start:2081 stop:2737 length:657 start_codon:yes stop_codon:yes gene_type:complete